MEPSKLRLLAEEYANDGIDAATYRARRRALIEAIERGDTAIDRGPRIDSQRPETRVTHRAWPRTGAMLALAVGVVALAVALLGRLSHDGDVAEPTATLEVNVPRQQITAARGLVEEFLAHRDFDTEALDTFTERWQALARREHTAAREEEWFAQLGRSVSREMRTQLALAQIGTTAPARERAERLRAFAHTVGITLDESPLQDTSDSSHAERSVASRQNLGGAEWLAIQAPDQLTLQLFAVSALEHVDRLMQRYSNVEMHVLKSSAGTPRYRVVHGSFDDVDTAKAAYGALPEDIRALSNGAMVKSIAALREDLSAPIAAAPADRSSDERDTKEDSGYTLQLFATANAANAQALIEAFPDLALKTASVVDSPSPHRVVLGRFTSVDDAREARQALPPELLSRIGRPLIKQRESLGLP